jgi:hypothetical protein
MKNKNKKILYLELPADEVEAYREITQKKGFSMTMPIRLMIQEYIKKHGK